MRIALFLLLFCTSCSPSEPPVSEQVLNVQARGLWLTANPLDAPPGALSTAENAVIRRPGVVEPRRGQKPDTDFGSQVDAMAAFEGSVLEHLDNGDLDVRTAEGTFTTLGSGFTAPTGHPMRFAEAGGGLYFTTSAGLQRVDSPTSAPVAAGVPPGLEGSGTTTGSSGWLANGSTVGYRFVWGTRDGDGALLIGAPSGRMLVTNAAGAARDVLLTAVIPTGITTSFFLQVYRTVITTTGGADPGEDMAQVAEVFPSPAQIAAGTFTLTDSSSFANGAAAYFSPNAGAGIADAKEQPPLLTDALQFKGYLFGVVQTYMPALSVSLLGVSGAQGLTTFEGIQLTDGVTTETYICDGVAADEGTSPSPGFYYFYRQTSGTAGQNIEATARSLVRVLNLRSAFLTASYTSSPGDLPGMMVFRGRSLSAAPVEVRAYKNAKAWSPTMRMYLSAVPTRAAGVVTMDCLGSPHRLVVGDQIVVTVGQADFPAGLKTVTSTPTNDTFTYAEAGASVTGASMAWRTNTDEVDLQQEAVPGSWAHSAFQEPDAWPPRFRYQVGGPNTRLDRITAQGEALLFWTSDGLYRLTGEDEDSFTLRPVDPTVQLVGKSTPVSMGNRAFALTTQGVVSVTELGVEKVSTPVDLALLPYYASTDARRSLTDSAAFAIGYQSENEYMLFLPDVNGSPGTQSTQAYIYNTQTGAWTHGTWTWSAINPTDSRITTGLVNPSDNFLYLASESWVTRERKDRALTDQQDADGVGIPFDVAYQVQTASNPGALKWWQEATVLLEAPQPAAVTLLFSTEINATPQGGSIPSVGNEAVRTYIPRDMSRSARITVELQHSTAQERPSVLGLSLVYNPTSTRVGR